MNSIPEIVLRLVEDLPAEQAEHLARLLENESDPNWGRRLHLLRAAIPQVEVQERALRFISEWQSLPQPPTAREMAMLLESVSLALAQQRGKQKIELTWTGPHSSQSNLRRTDQALMELIHEARERILIVSFVVYKARAILAALEQAADRGVEITIVLESGEVSEGKIAYRAIDSLGAAVREKARVFIWPAAKRPANAEGKTGSLHAKAGVADGKMAYISSANLTEYAMTVNMEMGVLMRNAEIAGSIERHFEALIAQRVLMEVERAG